MQRLPTTQPQIANYYLGYKLDPDRALSSATTLSGLDLGGLVVGMRHRYNDDLSVYSENNYDMFGVQRSLTATYGVNYTPTDKWSVGGAIEYGDVTDTNGIELERVAVSASISYKDPENVSWQVKGESRFEDSTDPTKDRDTYLLSAGLTIKYNENWRFLGNIDAAISNSNQASILNGDYIEASIGYAYRPTDNDRFNALIKYTYLYDLPSINQVNASGAALGPAQRSHILSADVSYDFNQYLTVGAKYGFRIGEVSTTRTSNNFVKSSAHLGVLRADFHVVKNWDVLLEARALHTPEIDTTSYGALIGVYRHVGENFKIGVGYNFGQFSDNIADLTHDDGGVFINLVGKF
ncbi:MAG: transporter [Rhizobiaceae bacterium]